MTNRKVVFPQDFCLHRNENEWYYFSGMLETTEGKSFGLVFTLFQYGNEMGKFSYPSMIRIIDLAEKTSYNAQTFCAFADSICPDKGFPSINTNKSSYNWENFDTIQIATTMNTKNNDLLSLNLLINPSKDILLHGGNGFIQMGDKNLSGYYTITNLQPIIGTLQINNEHLKIIDGHLWLDHQWGDWTDAAHLWDWFSLRFDDGSVLMLFQFRDSNNKPIFGNWTYRDRTGQVKYGTDFNITTKRKYNNYPIDWIISLPSINAEFSVAPFFDNQTFSSLWEGICYVKGKINSSVLKGIAFVELCGY